MDCFIVPAGVSVSGTGVDTAPGTVTMAVENMVETTALANANKKNISKSSK